MHTPDIDLNLLHVFYAVFETKNVSVAADRLHLSQSAASHAITRLRKQLGDPLFVRTAGGMQATPFAEQLARPIGEALDSLRNSVRSAREFESNTYWFRRAGTVTAPISGTTSAPTPARVRTRGSCAAPA